jgi:hypothetical protein
MSLKSILQFLLLFFCLSCKNSKKDNIVQSTAQVNFFIEDSLVDIKNKFSLEIYNHDKIINSKAKSDSAFWELSDSASSDIRVVFSTGNNKVVISNIPAYVLMPKYGIKLVFGIDRIPFSDEVKFPIKDSNSYKDINVIYYIKINPLEQGLGRIFKSYKK